MSNIIVPEVVTATTGSVVATKEERPLPWRAVPPLIAGITFPVLIFGVALLVTAEGDGGKLAGGVILLLMGIGGLVYTLLAAVGAARSAMALLDQAKERSSSELPNPAWIPRGVSYQQALVGLTSLGVVLVATLVSIIMMDIVTGDTTTRTTVAPNTTIPGYADLEFAATPSEFRIITAQWDPHGWAAMGTSAGLHFLAALVYAGFMLVWNLRLCTVACQRGSPMLSVVASMVSMAAIPQVACYLCAHACVTSQLLTRQDVDLSPVALQATTGFMVCFFLLLIPSLVFAVVVSFILGCCYAPSR